MWKISKIMPDTRYAYLAGKIKIGHGATQYRSAIAPLLAKFGIQSLDPLRGKYDMGDWSSLSNNEVVIRDLQDIRRANVMVAVMMKCSDTSFGTPCEVMYAWEHRVPVILITNEKYLANHFWTKGLCSHIFFVDEEAGQTFDEILVDVAEHIGHWYGSNLEQEVYNDPHLVQEKSDCTPPDINPKEEQARADAANSHCGCDDALGEVCNKCHPCADWPTRHNIGNDGNCKGCDRPAGNCVCK